MLSQADEAIQLKQFSKARDLYRAALQSNEDAARAHEGISRSSYFLREYLEAETEAQAALDLRSDLHVPHLILAYIHMRRGDIALSIGEALEAIRIAPENSDALSFAGGLLISEGRLNEATELLEKAHALKPHDWLLRYNLGALLQRRQDYRGALLEYWQAFRARPTWSTLKRVTVAGMLGYRVWLAAAGAGFLTVAALGGFYLHSVLLMLLVAVPLLGAGAFAAARKERSGILVMVAGLLVLLLFLLLR